MEIGATNVGSIHQTYTPYQFYRKGDEKGYFSFGASALILLFKPRALDLDRDLLAHPGQEIKCLLGQSLGFQIFA
jgi:phosphatidylserine decarboxylase